MIGFFVYRPFLATFVSNAFYSGHSVLLKSHLTRALSKKFKLKCNIKMAARSSLRKTCMKQVMLKMVDFHTKKHQNDFLWIREK